MAGDGNGTLSRLSESAGRAAGIAGCEFLRPEDGLQQIVDQIAARLTDAGIVDFPLDASWLQENRPSDFVEFGQQSVSPYRVGGAAIFELRFLSAAAVSSDVMTRHRKDLRRAAAAINPLTPFGRHEVCWCGSGRKYEDCHLLAHLSVPGAPVPADTDDSIFIAPHTRIARDALQVPAGPVPLTTQVPVPHARPLMVPDLVRALAARPTQRAASHAELGALRYALLDMHGIMSPQEVSAGRHDPQLERLRSDLADGALNLARATLDRLLADAGHDDAPVVLGSDAPNPVRLVGQTLLWADHYLLDDRLADLAVAQNTSPDAWRSAIAELLTLRPLIEAGVVVPALSHLPLALLDDAVNRAVNADLADPGYVAWLERQVVIEGPTAREAAFVYLRDGYDRAGRMYLLDRVVAGTATQSVTGTVQYTSRVLNLYDPTHDYEPWLATVRRQVLAGAVRDLVADVSAAHAVGAQYVTTSPFRARALKRRPGRSRAGSERDISGAIWADVPWLPDADPALLVKIAASEERVHELRSATARALRTVRDGDLARSAQAVTATAEDLRSAAAGLRSFLKKDLDRTGLVPAGLAAGSVLVTGTPGVPVLASAALAAGAALVPAVATLLAAPETASYAFWLARPRRRRR